MVDISGIINIHKEKGYTSHDVVNIVRKKLGRIKTGHTGTLDPDATGVLPICVGKATKLSSYIMSGKKSYTATVCLGHTTTTQDASGEIIKSMPVNVCEDDIKNVLKNFIGEIEQTPPMYSAIKINGQKLCDIARKGIEIERKSRKVFIYDIRIDKILSKESFIISVDCSKGSYIRTLCNDIGEALSCGAYMKELVRTRSGDFFIEDAIKLDELARIIENGDISRVIKPMELALSTYKKAIVCKKASKFLYNGNRISINFVKNKREIEGALEIFVYDEDNTLVGLYTVCNDYIKPITMLL